MIRLGFERGISPDRWIARWHEAGRAASIELVGHGEGLAMLQAGRLDILLTRPGADAQRADLSTKLNAQSLVKNSQVSSPDSGAGAVKVSDDLRRIRLYAERVGAVVSREGLFMPSSSEATISLGDLASGTLMQELFLTRRDGVTPEPSVDIPADAEGEQRALRIVAALVENDPEGYLLAPLSVARALATKASAAFEVEEEGNWFEPSVVAVLPALRERGADASGAFTESGSLANVDDDVEAEAETEDAVWNGLEPIYSTEDELQDFVGVLRGRRAVSGRMTARDDDGEQNPKHREREGQNGSRGKPREKRKSAPVSSRRKRGGPRKGRR